MVVNECAIAGVVLGLPSVWCVVAAVSIIGARYTCTFVILSFAMYLVCTMVGVQLASAAISITTLNYWAMLDCIRIPGFAFAIRWFTPHLFGNFALRYGLRRR